MVAINSSPVRFCKEILKDTPVHVGAAISFPLGQTTIETKCFETQNAIDNGADEIDYVINVGEVKNGNYAYIEEEMRRITEIWQSRRRSGEGDLRELLCGKIKCIPVFNTL